MKKAYKKLYMMVLIMKQVNLSFKQKLFLNFKNYIVYKINIEIIYCKKH